MASWYIYRAQGAGSPISWAGQFSVPGFADTEILDDTIHAELIAYLNPSVGPKPTELESLLARLAAGLVNKGLLLITDLPGPLQTNPIVISHLSS